MKHEINPPEHDIDAVYERLEHATLDELSRLIPHWGIRHPASGDCELLVLWSRAGSRSCGHGFSGAGAAAKISSIERSKACSGMDEGRKDSEAFHKHDGEIAVPACSDSTDTTL